MKLIVLSAVLSIALIPAISYGESYSPEYKLENKEQLQLYSQHIKEALKHAPHDNLHKLRSMAKEKAKYFLLKAQRNFNVSIRYLTGVHFADLVEEAGNADVDDFAINLNEIMYLRNVEKFMEEIIPHEIAHLVAFQMNGCQVHECNSFRSVMKYLIAYYTVGHRLNTNPSCLLNHALQMAKPRTCDSCTLTILPSCDDL